METDGNYVYRLLDKNRNILYIGKTRQLQKRLNKHLKGLTNLPKECVDKIAKIQYLRFTYVGDMDIYELYLINYYHPPYNQDSNTELGIIRLPLYTDWNDYDIINKCKKNISKEKIIGLKDKITLNLKFNRSIFTNEKLTNFIEQHLDKTLNNDDLDNLKTLCNLDNFDFELINKIIPLCNSKYVLTKKDNTYLLKKRKNGRCGYGSLFNWSDTIMCYKIQVPNGRKAFFGEDKITIADKVEEYLDNYNCSYNKFAI